MLSRPENLGVVGRPDWKLLTMEVIYVDDSIIPVIPPTFSGFDVSDFEKGTRKVIVAYRCSWKRRDTESTMIFPESTFRKVLKMSAQES